MFNHLSLTRKPTVSKCGPKNLQNARSQIPIYGLAFGEDADFNLLRDISNSNKGFAQKIYESGNSFEQLENFYNKISGNDKTVTSVFFTTITNF